MSEIALSVYRYFSAGNYTDIPVSESALTVYRYSSVCNCIVCLRIFQCRKLHCLHCLFTDIPMSKTALSVFRYSSVGNLLSIYRYSSVGNCIVCLRIFQCRKPAVYIQIFRCWKLHCLYTDTPVSETTLSVYRYSSVGNCIVCLQIFQCRDSAWSLRHFSASSVFSVSVFTTASVSRTHYSCLHWLGLSPHYGRNDSKWKSNMMWNEGMIISSLAIIRYVALSQWKRHILFVLMTSFRHCSS